MKKGIFIWVGIFCGMLVLSFILLPLFKLLTAPSIESIKNALMDKDVVKSIWLSIYTAGLASIISFFVGTPFAYLLARKEFFGKRLLESIVDIPIVIPHPVVGIAILSVVGKNYWLGNILYQLGIRIMNSITGIVTVLIFVGLPFYINTVKNGFEDISPRLENISRSLGASMTNTFFRITFPLAFKSIVTGFIICFARAISEFGAVVIVAYHPMIAPVLIYERFEGYGLAYSQPICFLLIAICLILFLILRVLSIPRRKKFNKIW